MRSFIQKHWAGFMLTVLFLSNGFSSYSQTNVSGIISADSVFRLSASPFVVTANLVLDSGYTLTIEPGVIVKFNANTSMLIRGTLLANQSNGAAITFTANTNSPVAGYWGGISFAANASAAVSDGNHNYVSGSIINNARIQYAGSSVSGVFGAIAMTGNAGPYIKNVVISDCAYPGIYAKSGNSKLVIKRSVVQNCSANSSAGSYQNNAAGINIKLHNAQIVIDSCVVYNNSGAGIAVLNSTAQPVSISYSKIFNNNNIAGTNGGGLYLDAHAQVFYNQIYKNSANRGAGLFSDTIGTSGGKVYNNIFYGNVGNEGAAFYGATDTLRFNVFAYHNGTGDVVKAYRSQYNFSNQYINNTSPYPFRYFGPYENTAKINQNAFSNNNTVSSASSILRFDGTPLSVANNNLMTNTGYTYTMQMQNNDNTAVVTAQNCYWKTPGTLNPAAISALIYDVNDDVNQGQINFAPFQTSPRLDCPISGVIQPKKIITGDSVLVYWQKKVGENIAGYKVYYGGSNGVLFSKVFTSTSDTFCKISALENIDSLGVSAYNSAATQTPVDFISGAQAWYTFAEWQSASNPTISSFSPQSGTTGTLVTISGTGFTGATQVLFGGIPASSFVVNSATSITATVARGASGNVMVVTPLGSVTLYGFTYVPVPVILSFTPSAGTTGNTIRISGFNFTGTTTVTFGGTNAGSYTLSGDTVINAILGLGASGSIIVINPFGSDTISGFTFCSPFTLTLPDTSRACGDSLLLSVSNSYKTYLWNTGDTTSSVYVKVGGKYFVSVTTAQGCVGSDTSFVVLNPNPSPSITGEDTVCAGSSLIYTTPSNAGRSYTWSVNGGTISSGQGTASVNILWGAAGIGTLTLKDSVLLTGCKVTDGPDTIRIASLPAPVISGKDTVCAASTQSYQTSRLSGHYYTWTVPGGVIINGQGTDSINVIWAGASSRTITVVDSVISSGCKGSANFSVTIFANPTPVVSGPATACKGSTQVYTTTLNSGRTYTWAVNNGIILSGQGTSSISVQWNNLPLNVGVVTVTDSVNATHCKGISTDYNVSLLESPLPVISGNASVCANTAASYTTTKGSGHSFLWTISGGNITFGQGTDSIRVTWLAAGTGTLTVKDSINATGCKTTTAPFSVTINANPTPVISGLNQVCAGTTQNYKATKNANHTYTWTVTGGTIISGAGTDSIMVTWGTGATGTLRVVDSVNVTGCKGTSSLFVVTINATPAPVISGSNSVCEGSTMVYTTPINVGRNYLWTISGGTINSGQGTSTIAVIWGASGIGTLTVRDSVNTTGCKTTTAPFLVTINPVPTPVISGLVNVCSNSTYNYSSPSNAGHSYKWNITGGAVTSGLGTSSVNILWGAPGIGTITITDSLNGSGCKTTTLPYTVTINSTPTPSITGNNKVCAGTTSSYSTPSNAGRSYLWNVSGGTIATGQGTNAITVNWGIAGTGTVTVTDSIDGAGCKTTTLPYAITISETPTPSVSGANVVCSGGTYVYTTPGNTGRTYTWDISGGTIVSGQGTSSVSITWGAIGLGTVTVTDSVTGLGCKATTTAFQVNIISGPSPSVNGSASACANTTSTYSTVSNPGRSYYWYVSGGTIINGQGTASVDITWGAVGSGTVYVSDSIDATGCKAYSAILNVAIGSNTNPIISGSNYLCEFATAQYGTINFPNHSFIWNATGGTILSGQGTSSVMVQWGSAGARSIELLDSVIGSGCKSTGSRAVTVNPTPNASFTPVQSMGHITFVPNQSGLNYFWRFGDGDSSNSSYPTHTYAANGTYNVTVHVVSAAGCMKDTAMDVVVTTVGLQAESGGMFGIKAYPNPFNGQTTLAFELPESASVELEVYDLTGRLVQKLNEGSTLQRGTHEYVFDATQNASSIYLVKLKVNESVSFIRLVQTGR